MTTSIAAPAAVSAAHRFLDGLARRDFAALYASLDPDVAFRALVPPGPFTLSGADDVTARFRRWFGGDGEFAVLDSALDTIGDSIAVRWRIWLRGTAEPEPGRVVEQHAFVTGTDRIATLDLLCCGFKSAGHR